MKGLIRHFTGLILFSFSILNYSTRENSPREIDRFCLTTKYTEESQRTQSLFTGNFLAFISLRSLCIAFVLLVVKLFICKQMH